MKERRCSLMSWISLAVLMILGTSCEEFLNEVPGDKAVPSKHYKTAIEINVAYLGAYSLLQDVATDLVITNGLRGDLMQVTGNADTYLQKINRHLTSELSPYTDASNLYKVVIAANEVLANLDPNISDPDFTMMHYNKVYGSLVGLRSWAYFTLARLYGEVAYLPDNLEGIPPGHSFEYLSREAVFQSLVSDLDSLVLTADLFYPESDLNVDLFRINNHALLGEIYLELDSFQLAADYLYLATRTGSEEDYKVSITYAEERWKYIFISSLSRQSTVMTAVPFSQSDQQENVVESLTNFGDEYALKPSAFIVSMYENQTNKVENADPGDLFRGLGTSYDTVAGNHVISKYNLNESQGYSADVILYRAADIHLMLAEALNRLGESGEALKILNIGNRELLGWSENEGIRGRVALADLAPGDGSIEYTENLIISERAMELAFEGKRWFDLMRIARRRDDNAYLANFVARKFSDPQEKQEVKSRLMDEANWYLPVIK
ncbi:MAG: RagB/SusD family nutrient uptake outer membrane protein [Bacteroidota bacterium]